MQFDLSGRCFYVFFSKQTVENKGLRMTGFNEWWTLWPKKTAKLVAMKAYAETLKKGYTDAELLAGLERYLADLKLKPVDIRFVPYPATWLRAGRFLDESGSSVSRAEPNLLDGRGNSGPPEGYGAIIHRKIGDALFRAYFRDCGFGPRHVVAPSQARKDYILNKFGYRMPDLDVRIAPAIDLGSSHGSELVGDPHENLPRTIHSNEHHQSGLPGILPAPQTPESS